jgi:CDP-4-dehydro-6-deoxyglucose reductase, E1
MIKLAVDTIDNSDLRALTDWISTRPQLTKGDLVIEFEKKIAGWIGVKEAVFVNSGSSANLLMLYGLMCSGLLKKGDKVVIPAICWATDIAPIIQLGLEPIVVDVNLRNVGADTKTLEEIFSKKKPAALLLVSVLGMAPDMEEIAYLCDKYKVTLLEDNCESIGSTYDGHKLGTFGYASTISTYFGHHMSTIEGGVVFTNDEVFAEILRMIRAHGWDRDLPESSKNAFRFASDISDFNARYTFYFPGFNFRPTEINAFLGLRQLEKLDSFIERRKENFAFYQEYIHNEEWKPLIPIENLVSNLGYPLIHKKRNKIAAALDAVEVECRPFISGNIVKQPAFRHYFNNPTLPNADLIHELGMYLPNHSELSKEELYIICQTVNKVTK